MRLTDFIDAEKFVAWATDNLEAKDEAVQARTQARIIECSQDEGLLAIAGVLVDDHLEAFQGMGVLVALDLYLQDQKKEGKLLVFSSQDHAG